MKVTPFAPRKELAPFVSSIAIVEAREQTERTLLPDTGVVLGLRYAGSATLIEGGAARPMPSHTVTGLRSTARRMRTSAGGAMVVVKLTELSAQAFLSEPMHHLFGATRPLEHFFSAADIAEVSRRVARADGDQERVAMFQQFLMHRCSGREPDPVVAEALRLIGQDPGGIRIARLAKRVALSQDAFEKRFRRIVGMSPKAYASLLHFKRAIDAYPRARATLTELAAQVGFYDQSHFIRRFQAVAGAPPGSVLGSEEYC